MEIDHNILEPPSPAKMQCSLPPHAPLSFQCAEDFDVHYIKEHTNRCTSCGKNFPSTHYLSLHIDENHNPLREELAAKGEKTYACLVEDCERTCSTPQKRRMHLIDKHLFPKMYNFRIIDYGIDQTASLLQGGQRRRLSTYSMGGDQRRLSLVRASREARMERGFDTSAAAVIGKERTDASETQNVISTQDVDQLQKSFDALKFVPPSVTARQRNQKQG